MPDNYKHLYEQMKTMVEMYQDELVPGLRKKIEELEQSRVEVVRCKDCKHHDRCEMEDLLRFFDCIENPYCAAGERKEHG